jgi:hypothetical protein
MAPLKFLRVLGGIGVGTPPAEGGRRALTLQDIGQQRAARHGRLCRLAGEAECSERVSYFLVDGDALDMAGPRSQIPPRARDDDK